MLCALAPCAGGYPQQLGQRINSLAESILSSYGVPILDTYKATISMHEGHILFPPPKNTVRDCLHYCSPGIPEYEIYMMFRALQRNGTKPLGKKGPQPQCLPVTEFRPPAGEAGLEGKLTGKQVVSGAAAAVLCASNRHYCT
jgi:hypothetical protein